MEQYQPVAWGLGTPTLEYVKTKGDSDESVIQDGVRVFVEKKTQITLLGRKMDYVEDK